MSRYPHWHLEALKNLDIFIIKQGEFYERYHKHYLKCDLLIRIQSHKWYC